MITGDQSGGTTADGQLQTENELRPLRPPFFPLSFPFFPKARLAEADGGRDRWAEPLLVDR